MRVEPRYSPPTDEHGHAIGLSQCRGLVLICENEEESRIVDAAFGDKVASDGVIARGEFEVRLSDDVSTHYVYLKKGASDGTKRGTGEFAEGLEAGRSGET